MSENILPFDGEAYIIHDFLCPNEGLEILNKLKNEINWKQEQIQMFGKMLFQPRLSCWMGDPDCSYKYSKTKFTPKPWTKTILELKDKIESKTHHRFNSVLLNYYRDHRDSMGLHNDNEKELGINPVIASLSLGATRKFNFKHIKTAEKVSFDIPANSLLIMQGETQNHWKHELPKSTKELQARINLTYRRIYKLDNS